MWVSKEVYSRPKGQQVPEQRPWGGCVPDREASRPGLKPVRGRLEGDEVRMVTGGQIIENFLGHNEELALNPTAVF